MMMFQFLRKTIFPKLSAALLILCLLCGCTPASELRDQVVTVEGLSITLRGTYVDQKALGLFPDSTFAYGHTDVLIEGYKQKFEHFETVPDLAEYMTAVISSNGYNARYVETGDPVIIRFDLKGFGYYAAAYKCQDAFWLIFTRCPADAFASMEGEFLEYLHSVQL